jgi:multidrug efflux pump subunit AcrA (membrane-fusion protein)
MHHPPVLPITGPGRDAFSQLAGALDQLSRRARQEIPPAEFRAELLEWAVSTVAADGGSIWRKSDGEFRCESQRGRHFNGSLPPGGNARHTELLEGAARSTAGRISLLGPLEPVGEGATGESSLTLLHQPLASAESEACVLELLPRSGSDPRACQGYLALLGELARIAGEFEEYRQAVQAARSMHGLRDADQVALRLHAAGDVHQVALVLAHEVRRLSSADRASVLVWRGRRMACAAVSGADSVDRRANAVKRLEDLATAAALVRYFPLRYPQPDSLLPPQLETVLNACLDETHARELFLIPLSGGPPDDASSETPWIGAIVVESFVSGRMKPPDGSLDSTARHAAVALTNARRIDRVPFLRSVEFVRRSVFGTDPRPRRIAVAVLVCALLSGLALWLIPARFEVEARGRLQPAFRREVFAPADALVDGVLVRHAQRVTKGEVLAHLVRPELDFELTRVQGELATARERLAAVRAVRLSRPDGLSDGSPGASRLSADEDELVELVRSLQTQASILEVQRAELEVKSPMDGQVVNWDAARRLQQRPVRRGQSLFTVADLNGPWVLELDVDDDYVEHLVLARSTSSEPLPVSFIVAADPTRESAGRLASVGLATEAGSETGPLVRATVNVESSSVPFPRPGSTVIARVDCGRRSLGYVLFGDLYRTLRRWLFI